MVLYCRVVVSMNLPYRIVMVFGLGLVSNMTAPSLVVLSMNPSGSMRGAGMMSLVFSMEKGRLKACPVVAVGCLSFDRADRGPRRFQRWAATSLLAVSAMGRSFSTICVSVQLRRSGFAVLIPAGMKKGGSVDPPVGAS